MSTRAIHIEVTESMESSSFVNAMRRFLSIRGPVKQLRSDCGTNFLGACKDLGIDSRHCNNEAIQKFLSDNGYTWVFNPPHASHMGGSWERMIGVTRRILDSMLAGVTLKQLTHEVLTTFLAEVTAIVTTAGPGVHRSKLSAHPDTSYPPYPKAVYTPGFEPGIWDSGPQPEQVLNYQPQPQQQPSSQPQLSYWPEQLSYQPQLSSQQHPSSLAQPSPGQQQLSFQPQPSYQEQPGFQPPSLATRSSLASSLSLATSSSLAPSS
ncbi:hypothetical protein L3Q82_023000 [Scortum barcoo]|uniref:Uncharacterized protein n=1 Tax=Scortum barcoo TaxID=214431 RepID=A0ACB8WYC8_9TELE|nr:hypothetical protein L3Q82_023000 [Scortum barcoo]